MKAASVHSAHTPSAENLSTVERLQIGIYINASAGQAVSR